MNELEVCAACRAQYDVGTDSWWPPDCVNCEARFHPRTTCEHICTWVLVDFAITTKEPP